MPLHLLVNALPLEIWQQVFTYTCTDGGYSGTSLALVNKFFHIASHPVRFQSLSFSTLMQIEGFLSYIRAYQYKHHDSKLRIRHLLLSFPNFISTESHPEDDVGPSQSRNVWFMMRQQREHEKAAWDRRFLEVVPGLLHLAAPHLETLALLQSDGFTVPTIRIALPRLRELTLLVGISVTLSDDEIEHQPSSIPETVGGSMPIGAGYSPFTLNRFAFTPPFPTTASSGADTSFGQGSPSSPTMTSATSSLGDLPHRRFPALERLHIVCGRHSDWTLREPLAHLMRLAPALSHLRISNTTYMHGQDDSIPGFLRDALGMPGSLVRAGCHDGTRSARALMLAPSAPIGDPPADEVNQPAGLPGLRRVVLHSVPPPDSRRCGSTHKDYCGLVGAVKAIADALERSEDVRVRCIEGQRMRCKDWGQLIRAQWENRITGGCGCWEDDGLKQTL